MKIIIHEKARAATEREKKSLLFKEAHTHRRVNEPIRNRTSLNKFSIFFFLARTFEFFIIQSTKKKISRESEKKECGDEMRREKKLNFYFRLFRTLGRKKNVRKTRRWKQQERNRNHGNGQISSPDNIYIQFFFHSVPFAHSHENGSSASANTQISPSCFALFLSFFFFFPIFFHSFLSLSRSHTMCVIYTLRSSKLSLYIDALVCACVHRNISVRERRNHLLRCER
jgi:hypothetical protein